MTLKEKIKQSFFQTIGCIILVPIVMLMGSIILGIILLIKGGKTDDK